MEFQLLIVFLEKSILEMIWRRRWQWKIVEATLRLFIKTPSFATACVSYRPKDNIPPRHSGQQLPVMSTINITPQVVQSTLLNCSSDLISLSFFLWCARQPNFFHDKAAFDVMVTVLIRLTRKFVTVEEIINQLGSIGCVKKPQTLLLLLRIYWRAGMYDMVFEAFEEMIHYGYNPNTFARNITVDVLFKIGRVDVALGVLRETQTPNFLSYSIAICNLCKLNDMLNLQGVLRSMLTNGYYLNAETFLVVLNSFCKLGRLPEALQLLGLMITLGIPTSVNVWSILIDGFCRSGRLVTAANLLEKMVKIGCSPNVVTCTSLIKGFMESRMPSNAFRVLVTMESKGCSPDLVLCNVLIDCLSKMGRYDDALDVFFRFPERELIPDSFTFCSIVSAVCSSRRFSLLPMLASAVDVQADIVVYNSLLNYFCKSGYPSGAVELYNDMLDGGFKPDRYTYAGLLTGLCRAGRVSEAVDVYLGIVATCLNLDAHVHTIVVDGLIKSHNFHKAVKLFRKAYSENIPLDVVSYTVAINGLLKGGRFGEAYTLYLQMKEAGVTPNACTYNVMLSGFCRGRDAKMVVKILREIIDAEIEVDSKSLGDIRKFLFRSRYFHSVCSMLIELCDLGLVPGEAMSAVLLDGLARGINFSDEHQSPLKSKLVDDVVDVVVSSADDHSDVAVSVG